MRRKHAKFNPVPGHFKPVGLLKKIGLLPICVLLMMAWPAGSQERAVRRYDAITQQPSGSVQGHPKLVALLVGRGLQPRSWSSPIGARGA